MKLLNFEDRKPHWNPSGNENVLPQSSYSDHFFRGIHGQHGNESLLRETQWNYPVMFNAKGMCWRYIYIIFFSIFCLFFLSFTHENKSDSHELVVQNFISAIIILMKCHYVKAFYDMCIMHILHTFVCQ